MRNFRITSAIVCVGLYFSATNLYGQAVTLGTWLSEGEPASSVTGSGDTFTANPVAVTIASSQPFAERNARRQKVYQQFTPIDFSSEGTEYKITFDIAFSGDIKNLDSDFRMTLIDTSTNQGIYPISWDTGNRVATYARSRFVDNLDGNGGGADGFDPWGGNYNDAINGNDNIPNGSTGAAPEENNGATALNLIDGNTLSYEVVMTRDAGNDFSFTTNATEQNGDVVYPEVAGTFDMVVGNGLDNDGFASVRGAAINSFDGIVFGIFDDDPFTTYDGNQGYTVSNLSIIPVLLGDFNSDGIVNLTDLDEYFGSGIIGAPATGAQEALDLDGSGTVDATDLVIHYTDLVETSNGGTGTFAGDANLDGVVDVLGDAATLIDNLGIEATSWSQGDFNADGAVDVLGDAAALIDNLGESNSGTGASSVSAVPEPSGLALLALTGFGFAIRRRR